MEEGGQGVPEKTPGGAQLRTEDKVIELTLALPVGHSPLGDSLKTQATVPFTRLAIPKVTKSHASQAVLNDESAVPEHLIIFPTLSVC